MQNRPTLKEILAARLEAKETIAVAQIDLHECESAIIGLLMERGDTYFFNVNWKRVEASARKGQLE